MSARRALAAPQTACRSGRIAGRRCFELSKHRQAHGIDHPKKGPNLPQFTPPHPTVRSLQEKGSRGFFSVVCLTYFSLIIKLALLNHQEPPPCLKKTHQKHPHPS